MTEPVVNSYVKPEGKKGKTKKIINKDTVYKAKNFILYRLLGFILALAMPYGNFAPLGLVFMTIERKMSKKTLLTLLMVAAGSCFLDSKILSAKYIGAELMYVSILFVLEKGIKMSLPVSIGAALVSLFVTGMTVLYWQGITVYSVILLFVELLIAGLCIVIMDKFNKIDFSNKDFLKSLKTNELISFYSVIGFALMGFKSVYIGNLVSVMNVFAATIVLVAGISTNAAVSAVCGLVVGLICGIETDYFLPMIGSFGFCGFLSGIFSKFGKGGGVAGLILANTVLVVYTNNAIEPMLKIFEVLFASAIFYFIPERVIGNIKHSFEQSSPKKEDMLKLVDNVKLRLKAVSESFSEMSLALENLSDRQKEDGFTDLGSMFDSVANKICRSCKKTSLCWDKNFNATYRALFSLVEKMEKEGVLRKENVDGVLQYNCPNLDKLLEELSRQYDIYNVKRIWKNKLVENRALVGQQLSGVSQVMDGIVEEITDKNVLVPSAARLRCELKKRGFKIKTLDMFCDLDGKINVDIIIKSSHLKKGTKREIQNVIGIECGRNMELSSQILSGGKYELLNISERERFIIEPGIAACAFSEKSGDNYRFFRLNCGKYVVVLSDGMGTGDNAYQDSKIIVELLNRFLSAGFNNKVAIKLINSIMIMKSENQVSATIDICIIDLYTGEVEFVKTGAEPSYIKYNNRVETVKASSLPTGLIAEAEPESFLIKVKDETTIFMITDGIESKNYDDKWIKEFIERENPSENAEVMAKKILSRAVSLNGGEISDDMTVISIKMYEKV